MKWMQRNIVALVVAGALSLGLAVSAAVQAQGQSGLVNVSVGNIEILNDVKIGVAAQIAAEICGTRVGPVVLLAMNVVNTGEPATVCTTAQNAPVVIF